MLDKQRLGQLSDLVSNIRVGDAESRSKDVIGRVYEYFRGELLLAPLSHPEVLSEAWSEGTA